MEAGSTFYSSLFLFKNVGRVHAESAIQNILSCEWINIIIMQTHPRRWGTPPVQIGVDTITFSCSLVLIAKFCLRALMFIMHALRGNVLNYSDSLPYL